jgi:hypothetical protein
MSTVVSPSSSERRHRATSPSSWQGPLTNASGRHARSGDNRHGSMTGSRCWSAQDAFLLLPPASSSTSHPSSPTMTRMDTDPDQVSAEPDLVRSPGGWMPPTGSRPGWNWLPPSGGTADLLGMPRWVRTWYRTPFLDRRAHVYMWRHGYWFVERPGGRPDDPDEGDAGVREPRSPGPASGAAAAFLSEDDGA